MSVWGDCNYLVILWTQMSKRPQTIPNVFAIPLPANDVISLLIGRSECNSIVDKLDHFLMTQSEERWRHFQPIGGLDFGDADVQYNGVVDITSEWNNFLVSRTTVSDFIKLWWYSEIERLTKTSPNVAFNLWSYWLQMTSFLFWLDHQGIIIQWSDLTLSDF